MAALRAARAASAPTAFVLAFAAALAVALAQGGRFFHYDSGEYWALSETIAGSGAFPFFEYENNGVRGYSLPLIFWTLRNLGELFTPDHSLIVKPFNAAAFALIGTVLAPRLTAIAWPDRSWGVTRRLLLTALIMVFWSGYLNYPLSDFPALAFALLALIAVSRSDSPGWLLVAGLSAGLALNMRSAYLLLSPILVGLLIWSWVESGEPWRASLRARALCAVALLGGLASVAIPQSIFQHEEFDSYSPVPGTPELRSFQYTVGLGLQRYDTYLGPTPKLEYVDGHTAAIVAERGRIGGVRGYLGAFVDHPIAMAGGFLRRAVNGFDQRYTTPYAEQLESERSGLTSVLHLLLRVAGFLIVFLALVRVATPAGRAGLGSACWRYPAALLLLAAPALPSAMETRFMLPVFVLGSLVVLAPGWRETLDRFRAGTGVLWVLLGGVAYAALVWTIVADATDSLRLG